ncbi:MAG: hypothetical protein KAS30_01635 [Candidatus Diapherotrites archaeon]|nr:hypothetical protein [Candidatus Diapherotrites archaeon]
MTGIQIPVSRAEVEASRMFYSFDFLELAMKQEMKRLLTEGEPFLDFSNAASLEFVSAEITDVKNRVLEVTFQRPVFHEIEFEIKFNN